MRGKNGKRGRAGRGKGLLLFHFMGSPYAHTHTCARTHRAESNRQSQDVTSSTGREAKQRSSLFYSVCVPVLWGEVGASRAVRGRQRRRGARGRHSCWIRPPHVDQQGVALGSSQGF